MKPATKKKVTKKRLKRGVDWHCWALLDVGENLNSNWQLYPTKSVARYWQRQYPRCRIVPVKLVEVKP